MLAFPFCSFSMILLASIQSDIQEVTMLDKILLIAGKQVTGLKFNGFRVGSFFAIIVVWPVVSHSEKFSGWDEVTGSKRKVLVFLILLLIIKIRVWNWCFIIILSIEPWMFLCLLLMKNEFSSIFNLETHFLKCYLNSLQLYSRFEWFHLLVSFTFAT